MTTSGQGDGQEKNKEISRGRWILWGCVGVLLLAALTPRHFFGGGQDQLQAPAQERRVQRNHESPAEPHLHPARTAEEIVAGKVQQFARGRLRIARAMAKRLNRELPSEVEQFFNAVAAGRWEEINELFKVLQGLRDGPQGETLRSIWGPILEGQLIAECAHAWPAQKLLDYGQATLGSLAPGMVYVGGTDPGRGIPTLLNDTSEGDRHIVITQNGLADASYLEYVRFLYGDQMATLTPDETKQAFDEYITDAQKRLEHDRQFPNEPKQIRPGEDVQWLDDSEGNGSATGPRVKVSGAMAVMAINELLLKSIMDKNPGLSFALEESFPLTSTYASAVPLGPLMELRAPDVPDAYAPAKAQQTVDYWSAMAQQLTGDPDAPEGSEMRKTYSKMADAQANLLANHNDIAEAEQTYRTAMQIEPSSPEAVYGLANLYMKTGREDEAQQLLDNFRRDHPVSQPVPSATLIVPAPRPK